MMLGIHTCLLVSTVLNGRNRILENPKTLMNFQIYLATIAEDSLPFTITKKTIVILKNYQIF